jgi:hypothetical protein
MRGQKRVADARKRAYDPHIHPLCKKVFAKTMDCRVKPGNDELNLARPIFAGPYPLASALSNAHAAGGDRPWLAPQRPLPRLRGRDREGACDKNYLRKLTPSPTLPRKRGREQTEYAARLVSHIKTAAGSFGAHC